MNPIWLDHLSRQGAVFLDGRVADFGSNTPTDGRTLLCDLSHEGVIDVSGEDRAAFLHAQFSNDVLALVETRAQWNGWCSPKGRLLATFLIWQSGDRLHLQLPRALQAGIQKRLQMFVLRSKVKLTDAGDDSVRFGITGADAATLLAAEVGPLPAEDMAVVNGPLGQVIRLSATRFEISASPQEALTLWTKLAQKAIPAGADAWDKAMIEDGIITVLPATQDQFVPQMANFELIGGVSFQKGCYPGQEIVARTQYRGILKRRLVRVSGSDAAPAPGTAVYSMAFGDQAAGMVANSAATSGGFEALVVAQIEAIKSGDLHLAAADGPLLALQTLPYRPPELA